MRREKSVWKSYKRSLSENCLTNGAQNGPVSSKTSSHVSNDGAYTNKPEPVCSNIHKYATIPVHSSKW